MKASLQLRIGQHLTMTPQLQQAIRLLQLSTLDLQQEIQQALDGNPMLELDEDDNTPTSHNDSEFSVDYSEPSPASAASEPVDEPQPGADELMVQELIPDELPTDSQWDDLYVGSGSSGGDDDEDRDFLAQNGNEESLQDHLLWQMRLTPFSASDQQIALAIIDGIDERGYLSCSLDDILASIDPSLGVELDEVMAVLHRIQQFDPVGVAARDLSECLLIQLRQVDSSSATSKLAQKMLQDYSELLSNRDFRTLTRKLKTTEDELKQALQLIQRFNPYPGDLRPAKQTEYVIPDVSVRKVSGRWVVELNGDSSPRLRVNNSYASLIRQVNSSADNQFMRNQLQEAKWFIKSLMSRNETLLKVANCIVERQQAFLEYGEEAMRPLVLHDIAEAVEMHESTISRVTTQKYMHTPRGIFELKYFFSSHVSTSSGGECSSTAIRALIKKLIAAEDSSKPLSDSRIAEILAEQGIEVARRTVAKYREAMFIPPSNERKCLA